MPSAEEVAILGKEVRKIELPKDFVEKMKTLLAEEFEDFMASLHKEQSYGLRVNPLKGSIDEFMEKSGFSLREIPWVPGGFFYNKEDYPGRHPFHSAGVYYIQDPSAMAVVELMDPKPGEIILDLAAAPGGKATQIAGKMKDKGLLVANEIHPRRADILSENVERMGIKNAVVTNESPNRLAEHFGVYFDRILVDAPCSGEGMFRKNPEAILEWSPDLVVKNQERQLEILAQADKMLVKGGQLVYSTCTFSPEENEQIIAAFIKKHPEYKVERVEGAKFFTPGRKDWTEARGTDLKNTIRLWPHKLEGEGHFVGLLRKTQGSDRENPPLVKSHKHNQDLKEFQRFAKESLRSVPTGVYTLFGDELYITPEEMIDMKGLRVKRAGWHLGTNKRNRFEPSHALALSLQAKEAKFSYELTARDERVAKYLRGETFSAEGEKGWYVITVDGYSLGWGKIANRMMKNHYPKGLRILG